MAIEHDAAIITAVQTTRSGAGNSDLDISHTSESFGIPAICDFFAAIINTDELKQLNQLMFKQLKNRYTGISNDEKFLMGVDYLKMKLYELDSSSVPIPDNSKLLNKQSGKKSSDSSPSFDISLLQKSSATNDSFDGFNF